MIKLLTLLKGFYNLFLISLLISPVTWLLEKLTDWHVGNEAYVSYVLGAIVIDHILGSLYHAYWLKDFTIRKNVKGILTKLIIVISIGYLFEGLDSLTVGASIVKDYTVMVLRLTVFLYPASSAFYNSYEMTNKKFPPMAFMKRLEKFSENTNNKI